MAQLDLLTNQQIGNSTYKDVSAIRTTRFEKNMHADKSKEDNFQCSYFRPKFSKTSQNRNPINNNQSLTERSFDNTEIKSDNVRNVLRWLQSLPPSFMIDDLDKNMNYCKLTEKNRDLYRCGGNKSKSLGSSVKSAGGVPLEGKGMMLLEHKQRVNFADKVDSIKVRSYDTRKKLTNKKRSKNSSVTRLVKKCDKSNLPFNAKSQQSSINDNQCPGIGILKNVSRKNVTSTSQISTFDNKIASNRRLLHNIKEIINTVGSEDRINQIETVKKEDQIKLNEKTVPISSNVKLMKNSTKTSFLKNPEIEKKLDNAMRSTLKRYIRSNTWEDFQRNNKNINGELSGKREKRAIPSLEPVNSFYMDLEQNWSANSVLNNLRPLIK